MKTKLSLLVIVAWALSITALPSVASASCSFADIHFSSDFDSGRLDGCEQTASNSYTLTLKPENTPINPSPWYAFQVTNQSETAQTITITLLSDGAPARYQPRISSDKQNWQPVPYEKDQQQMQFQVTVADTMYVAGGEIIDTSFYPSWLAELAPTALITLGESSQGRPIHALEHRVDGSDDWLVIIGRQHPPEVTGALALVHFSQLLFSDDAAMGAFRQRYNILLVPMVNPDGVAAGNWRHNANGVDLNRDWKRRSQAETQAVHAKLTGITAAGGRIRLALDFHSTWRDVFYTMTADYVTVSGEPLQQPQLVNDWLTALANELAMPIENKPSHNPNSGVFKQYIADQFGVHGVTYEVGDQTDREHIKRSAEAALTTLIKQLFPDN